MLSTFFTVLFLTLTEYSSFQMMHILVRGYGLSRIAAVYSINREDDSSLCLSMSIEYNCQKKKLYNNFGNAMILSKKHLGEDLELEFPVPA